MARVTASSAQQTPSSHPNHGPGREDLRGCAVSSRDSASLWIRRSFGSADRVANFRLPPAGEGWLAKCFARPWTSFSSTGFVALRSIAIQIGSEALGINRHVCRHPEDFREIAVARIPHHME